MIHLDTSMLIAMVKVTDAHHTTARKLAATPHHFSTSAVAWMEFHSRPVQPTFTLALRSLLGGGIVPFDEKTAAFAGDLYHFTRSHRRARKDVMIAASAILAGAELATANPDDFQAFLPHGLTLCLI